MTTKTKTDPTLEELRPEVQAHVTKFRERRSELALEAVKGGEKEQKALDKAEADLHTAEAALDRIDIAIEEQRRRAAAAAEKAEATARSEALIEAESLQSVRESCAASIDEAIKHLCIDIAEYWRVCEEQAIALRKAGEKSLSAMAAPRPWGIEAAFSLGLRLAGVSAHVFERVGAIPPQHARPLVATDPKPIEPLKGD